MAIATKSKNSSARNRRPVSGRSAPEKKKEKEAVDYDRLLDQLSLVVGVLFMVLSVVLLISFLGYLFTGDTDHDIVQNRFTETVLNGTKKASNPLGLFGAYVSHWFIFKWFGIAALGWLPILFLSGYRLTFRDDLFPHLSLNRFAIGTIFYVFFTSAFLGYWVFLSGIEGSTIAGGIGFAINNSLYHVFNWGSIIAILFILFVWMVAFHRLTQIDDMVIKFMAEKLKRKPKQSFEQKLKATAIKEMVEEDEEEELSENYEDEPEPQLVTPPTSEKKESVAATNQVELTVEKKEGNAIPNGPFKGNVDFTIEKSIETEPKTDIEAEENGVDLEDEDVNEQLLKEFGLYDSKLDLAQYQYPPISLLSNHASANKVSEEELAMELEMNKNNIVETMRNFSIGISSIKATVGPTVTLYEIVPEAGVRISKIKNLEDDIALNLAALGIRIIAPMPGKGTIGIEVPNKNREMVSVRSLVSSDKFQKSSFDLPIILGKTISNEIFITDLAKMPHLLMAGATGQGKSVGINVILTSLLYKKHPSEIKFVMVDPKKVELTLFNKIERHFLAMLPNSEEAIITDNKKVIYTLNSLCIEMDNRYELLKEAQVRNIKEYNTKFVKRRLNPEKGHRFLPYIVLVIDELADLMMTAGKEVEQPIARLAQLARAIGIHLIVATQRPSVNVITGLIKANFPARISFKVTAKVDSRTILDTGGAEQLVGNGDMLLAMGSSMVRLQSPFVDTDEVESICEYIGGQRGYESAYLLPDFYGDDEPSVLDFNPKELDSMFEESARLIVNTQQGSTSLIQRKLKLGYNRAGRIMDQLEASGIVGPFEGSKAREVLVKTLEELEEILRNLRNKRNSSD